MAWPFHKNKRQIHPRKALSSDQEDKRLDIKHKKYAHEELIEMAKKDPALKREMIMQTFGYKIPERKEPDPAEEKKREIKAKLYDQALEEIDKDPELKSRYAQNLIAELVGDAGEGDSKGYSETLDELGTFHRVKEFLESEGAGNKGPLAGLWDPATTRLLLENIMPALMNRSNLPSPPRIYIIETKEGLVETDADGYRRYLEERDRKKLSAAPAKEVEAVPEVAPVEEEPKQGAIKLSDWIPYLDQDPTIFADHLVECYHLGDENAIFAINLLTSKTADEVIAMLEPFKKGEYEEGIEKIISNREWLEQVINLLKYMAPTEDIA